MVDVSSLPCKTERQLQIRDENVRISKSYDLKAKKMRTETMANPTAPEIRMSLLRASFFRCTSSRLITS